MNISKKQIHKLVLESLLLEGKYSKLIDLFKKAFNVNNVHEVPARAIRVMGGDPALENMYKKMKIIELGRDSKLYGKANYEDLADYEKMERALKEKLNSRKPSSPSPARKTTVATKTTVPKITRTEIDNLVNSPNAAQKINKVVNSKEAAKIFDVLIEYYEVKKVNEWSFIKKYITKSKDYKDVVKYKDQIISQKTVLIEEFKKLEITDIKRMRRIIMNNDTNNTALQIYNKMPQDLTKTEEANIIDLHKKISSFIDDIDEYKKASNKFSEKSKNKIIKFFTWFGENPIKTLFIAVAAIAVLGVSVVAAALALPFKFATEILRIINDSPESWTLQTYHKIRGFFGKKMPHKFKQQQQKSKKFKKLVNKYKNKKKWTKKDMNELRKEYENAMQDPI